MSHVYSRGAKPAGLAPGTLAWVGEHRVDDVVITIMDYDAEHVTERRVDAVDDCAGFRQSPTRTWINIDGLHDTGLLAHIGEQYGLHPLVLEDILHTSQRPKLEDYGDYLYIVCRMLTADADSVHIASEQISLIVGDTFVLSFQEKPGDVFDPVRERIRHGKGRIRTAGPDYLAYALLDAVVDNYFVLLETYGERIEDLEAALLENPDVGLVQSIHQQKREMIVVRRSVWPLREVVAAIDRGESDLVDSATIPFFRDVYDHVIQVADIVESYRDILMGLQDLYLSSISNRMNEVMKVLTIISTIFVPLTFVVGIYGMNFRWMPELEWRWGYPVVWLISGSIALGMLIFFRRKRWL